MTRSTPWFAGCSTLSLLLAMIPYPLRSEPTPEEPEPELITAQVNGKYRMLLRQFKAPADAKKHGDFKELGLRDDQTHGKEKDLPKGYWVYAKPYYFIWRDLSKVAAKRQKRGWGPEQATGKPDTFMAGDITTAWASKGADDQDEWLMLEYDRLINPTEVHVYETFNPGALTRITAFKLDGTEVELWKGQDPTAVGSGIGTSKIKVKCKFQTNRIKLYIASKTVAGWNEIDAVGLIDKKNKTHWAASAHASSTYAPPLAEEVDQPKEEPKD